MVYWLLVLIIIFILDLITTLCHTNRNKDLEIIILRQPVCILQRKVKTPLRISDPERMIMSILVDKFSQSTKCSNQRLNQVLSATSVRNILKRRRTIPALERSPGSWRSFLGHYREQRMAFDFFTVETIWLKTIYVLFFI